MNPHIRDNFNAVGPHLVARKTADQSVTSSTALANDSDLVLAVGSTDVWRLELLLRYEADSSANMKLSFGIPTSGHLDASVPVENAAATMSLQTLHLSTTDGATIAFAGGGAGAHRVALMSGVYLGGGTSGNVTLRWAQNTSVGVATIMKAQSTFWAVQLA